MTIWQFCLWLIQILLFTCLGALQFVEQSTDGTQEGIKKFFFNFVFENRLIISIILGGILALLTGWNDLYRPRKQAREIRQTIMEAMLEELFENDKINVRITIFKDANLFRRTIIYLKRFYVVKGAWRNFYSCVFVWERLGKKYRNSRTYFRFNAQTEAGCQGIAGVVRHREEEVLVENLPDLSSIDLNGQNMRKKKTADYKAVYKYMNDSYLGTDLETLKRLHHKARHMYGNVLSDGKGEFKGVLVIDSFHQNSPFTEPILDNIPYYLKLIATTL